MGRLVLKPLKNCSNLTRNDGVLTKNAKSQYHMNYQCRAAALLASFKQDNQDIRNALDSERMKQIYQNRDYLQALWKQLNFAGHRIYPSVAIVTMVNSIIRALM